MICLIALVIFGILGLFSMKYRIIALEAFDCVFRRVTLRKCDSGLDKRLKSQIIGKMMKRVPRLAKFTYKNFEIISWFFTILMLASIVQSGISVYNFAAYGNCNGPANEGFCIFDPFAKEHISSCESGEDIKISKELTPPTELQDYKSYGNANSSVKFIMFGCYTCEFTKKSFKAVYNIYEKDKDKVYFIFIDFPIPVHKFSFEAANMAQCFYEQDKTDFLDFAKELYSKENLNEEIVNQVAYSFGINKEKFNNCADSNRYHNLINQSIETGYQSGIYGTPTFFINDKHIVGPTTERSFSKLIEDELKK